MLISLPDGSQRYFEVHAYPVKDASGATVQAIEHGRDISQRKSLEMQLKTSEEKYRTIVELAREGIFIVDAEDKLTFANGFLAGMLGYDGSKRLSGGRFLISWREDGRAAGQGPIGTPAQWLVGFL